MESSEISSATETGQAVANDPGTQHADVADSNNLSPHLIVYRKMESLIDRMRDEDDGIPVRSYTRLGKKVRSVFTGSDLISWIMKNINVDDEVEALYLANKLSSHGYILPIADHLLHVKNDGSFYRFQTEFYYPSHWLNPEDRDYAVYLCQRSMQNKSRLELADFEAENLVKLKNLLIHKWTFIIMEANAQILVTKLRRHKDKKILESQERAFWDVHRPMPGAVNTTEIDYKKIKKYKKPCTLANENVNSVVSTQYGEKSKIGHFNIESLRKDITFLQLQHNQRNMNLLKIVDTYITYFELYAAYDPFITPQESSNPWISNNTKLWNENWKDTTEHRVKRWSFDIKDLLSDPAGKKHFIQFLEKEFSYENLRFWDAIQQFKKLPQHKISEAAKQIWNEYLSDDTLNIDSHSRELTRKNMVAPDLWTFDVVAVHVYNLMKRDSYQRYKRSEMYIGHLNSIKKKTSKNQYSSILNV